MAGGVFQHRGQRLYPEWIFSEVRALCGGVPNIDLIALTPLEATGNMKDSNHALASVLRGAYKKNIEDPRESPIFKLMELLRARGAILVYSDPHVPKLPSMRSLDVPDLSSQTLTSEYLRSLDCTIIAMDHSAFDYSRIVSESTPVVDSHNATYGIDAPLGRV